MKHIIYMHSRHLFLVSSLFASVAGCREEPTPAPAAPSKYYVLGIDRSGSRTAQQFADMQEFVAQLTTRLTFGDKLSLVEVMQSPADNVREYTDSVPLPAGPVLTGLDERMKSAMQITFRDAGRSFTDSAGARAIRWTDILSFLRRVSDYPSSAHNHRVVLILLSDMVHDTPTLDMSREVPGHKWIDDQQVRGLIPDLSGICVVAVGVDMGTVHATRLKQFWQSYFAAAGAELADGHYRASFDPTAIQCGVE